MNLLRIINKKINNNANLKKNLQNYLIIINSSNQNITFSLSKSYVKELN